MGDEPQKAIHALFEQYGDDIYRYVRYTLGNSADAHDIVQDVFFKAFRSWASFRHDTSEKNWLMHIARNCIVDLWRKRKKEKLTGENYEPPCQEDEYTTIETMVFLEGALSNLKDSYRQVFVLRYINNLSVRDTATVLGWTEGKVRMTYHRAVAQLQKELQEVKTDEFRERGSSSF